MKQVQSTAKYREWEAAVQTERKRGMDQVAAINEVDRKHPGLRQAMLKSVNLN